jgi:hypothetical protein
MAARKPTFGRWLASAPKAANPPSRWRNSRWWAFLPILAALLPTLAFAQASGGHNNSWMFDGFGNPIGSTGTGPTAAINFNCLNCSGGSGNITLPQTVGGVVNSGGVACFTGATTMASSPALTANGLVIGGGTGVCPSSATTGTGVLSALSNAVGSAGAFVVNGGALGQPSSGDLSNTTNFPAINLTGNLAIANFNGGTGASATTYWRGDGTWQPVSGGGSGVTSLSYTCPAAGPLTGPVTLPNGIGEFTESTAFSPANTQCGAAFDSTGGAAATLPTIGVGAGQVQNPYFLTIKNADTTGLPMTIGGGGSNINYNGTSAPSITLQAGQSVGIWINAANTLYQASGTVSGTQVFSQYHTVNYTGSPIAYTPAASTMAFVKMCISGGAGGGGSGGYANSGTAMSGGGGGGGGQPYCGTFTYAQVHAAQMYITLGAGGAGGTPPANPGAGLTANGGNGGAGTISVFGPSTCTPTSTSTCLLIAYAGGGAAGAQNNANSGGGGAAGTGSSGGSATGSAGGSAGSPGGTGTTGGSGSPGSAVTALFGSAGSGGGGQLTVEGNPGGGTSGGGGGGASGGPLTTAPGGAQGAAGGSIFNFAAGGTAGGASGGNGGAGGTTQAIVNGFLFTGGGGGGGGSETASTTVNGGNGGLGGCSGGGGGAGNVLNTATTGVPGTGGAGGAGCGVYEEIY